MEIPDKMMAAILSDLRWAFDKLRQLQADGLIELELVDEERLKRFQPVDRKEEG